VSHAVPRTQNQYCSMDHSLPWFTTFASSQSFILIIGMLKHAPIMLLWGFRPHMPCIVPATQWEFDIILGKKVLHSTIYCFLRATSWARHRVCNWVQDGEQKLNVVVQTYNLSTREAEAGGSWVQGQPGLSRENWSQKTKLTNNSKKMKNWNDRVQPLWVWEAVPASLPNQRVEARCTVSCT
jgi:hypothetical protein